MYHSFLASPDLLRSVQSADFLLLLQWVAGAQSADSAFSGMVDAILIETWKHVSYPDVTEAFASTVMTLFQQMQGHITYDHRNEEKFIVVMRQHDEERRRVLAAMLPLIIEAAVEPLTIVFAHPPFVTADDVPWLLDQLKTALPAEHEVFATWLRFVTNNENLDHVEAVRSACETDAELRAIIFPPSPDESSEARKLHEEHMQRMAEWDVKEARHRAYMAQLRDSIPALLARSESGEATAWRWLTPLLTIAPGGIAFERVQDTDIRETSGWRETDAATKAQILAAAKRYILVPATVPEPQFGSDARDNVERAAVKALRLLYHEDLPFVRSEITVRAWEQWIPAILNYPSIGDSSVEGDLSFLTSLAYSVVPEQVRTVLRQVVRDENAQTGMIFVTRRIEECWDDAVAAALLATMSEGSLTAQSTTEMLRVLLRHESDDARTFAKSFLDEIPINGPERESAVIAAFALIMESTEREWPFVWHVIQANPVFGKEVIERIAESSGLAVGNWIGFLTEEQLGDLYVWHDEQYPRPQGVQGRQPDGPWDWRDYLLVSLRDRGTRAACTAIEKIVHALPQYPGLVWTLQTAQENARRNEWLPNSPATLLTLFHNRDTVLLESGNQLLDLVMQSLCRFEERLHGDNPSVEELWDEQRPKDQANWWRPKDEDRLTRKMKDHLEQELNGVGVVANREVRTNELDRNDLRVEASRKGPNGEIDGVLTVTIEVKGCWHRDVKDAIATQLVTRYLGEGRPRHGLYVVGWYNCEKWGSEDSRKGDAPRWTVQEAREHLEQKAHDVSQQHNLAVKAYVLNTALPDARR